MATPQQLENLRNLFLAAQTSEHIFPDAAACEACLETGWLTSTLGNEYNNLFGQKQSVEPIYLTVNLPTQEVQGGHTFNVTAAFVWFPTKAVAFTERMNLLARLQDTYPEYKAALHAQNADDYVRAVSKRWSTDPDRAEKVLEIYYAHKALFAEVPA
jgi:flagellum-specific peptidoglycan hydrolase FlgJ